MEALSISFNGRHPERSEGSPLEPKGDSSATPQNDSVFDLGLTDYRKAHQKQLEIHSSIRLGKSDEVIIITEHYPIYTCGRTTKPTDRPNQDLIPVIDVERGGELTYHGPGQIVGYPILNLAKRRLSIPQYLRKLELVLIEALQEIDIQAKYKEEYRAGLWVAPPPVLSPKAIGPLGQGTGGGVGEKKLVSIGIAVRHWVTFHGFALNVDCDLTPFRRVNPCGLSGDQMTSLKELGCFVPKERVKECVVKRLIRDFF